MRSQNSARTRRSKFRDSPETYAMPSIASFSPLLLVLLLPAQAYSGYGHQDRVQALIDAGNAPDGVVFEIASGDSRFLDWALQEADRLTRQLRAKYPGLDVSIVSHGREQFALTRQRLADNAPLEQQLQGLVDADVPVHVCGTNAEWNGVDAEEFTALVDVAVTGPAQINDYVKLGYEKIRIVRR